MSMVIKGMARITNENIRITNENRQLLSSFDNFGYIAYKHDKVKKLYGTQFGIMIHYLNLQSQIIPNSHLQVKEDF